jgi:hypothetical protein
MTEDADDEVLEGLLLKIKKLNQLEIKLMIQ